MRARRLQSEQHGLIALVGASLVLRVAYLIEYSKLPFLWGPLFDSHVYLRQASAVHAGRLDDATLVAFSPLYGFFLSLFGPRPLEAPVWAQLALGVVNVVLVHQIGLSLGGRTAGLVAGVAWSAYGVIVFHETKLMSETLALTWLLVAMRIWVCDGFARGRLPHAAAAGGALAVAVLTRSSLLLSLPFVVIASALPWRGAPVLDARRRGLRALVLSAALVAPLLANGAWNLVRYGLFVPVTLASSTAARATSGSARWTGDIADLRPPGARDVSPWDVVREAEARIARARRGERDPSPLTGIDLVGWARGAPAKIVETFSDLETTSEYGYYGERVEVTPIAVTPLSFGAIAVVAGLGALLLARRRGPWALVPWLPFVLGTLATTTLFHPSTRYRLPMVVPLILLGAFAIAECARARHLAVRVTSLAVITLVTGAFAFRLYSYELRAPALWELRVAESAALRGDRTEALRRIERAQRIAPEDPAVARSVERIVRNVRP